LDAVGVDRHLKRNLPVLGFCPKNCIALLVMGWLPSQYSPYLKNIIAGPHQHMSNSTKQKLIIAIADELDENLSKVTVRKIVTK
jgi:hypothetical protein